MVGWAPLWVLAASTAVGQITIVSLNLARETDAAAIAKEFSAASQLATADVLLLQEVPGQTKETNVAEALAARLGYHAVAFPSSPEAPNQGLAILSKHPLCDVKIIPLKRYNLRFHSRVRFAIAATVATPSGPVRVWNAHLDSRIGSKDRLEQLSPILEDAQRFQGPALIGGDFNTTWFQWVFNVVPTRPGAKQVASLRAAFEKAKFQTPLRDDLVTYPFLSQHLDWIFSRGLEPKDSGVTPVEFSDHHAVWATFDTALVH